MSKFFDIAEAAKARLESSPALAGVVVGVDRQKDILSMVEQTFGKEHPAFVLVMFNGFSVPDRNLSYPVALLSFTAACWFRPKLDPEHELTPFDDIVSGVTKALHQWKPPGVTHVIGEAYVTGCDLVPDDIWLRYDVDWECSSNL